MFSKTIKITLLMAAILSPSGFAAAQDEAVANKPTHFTGLIERKSVFQLVSRTRGMVKDLVEVIEPANSKGKPLLTVTPFVPGYAAVDYHLPIKDGQIIHRYVQNGTFVEENQALLDIAQGEQYVVVVYVPHYEVAHFKQQQNLSSYLYRRDVAKFEALESLSVKAVDIQKPTKGNKLYRVELQLDCENQKCREVELDGALVNVVSHAEQTMQLSSKGKGANLGGLQ